MKTIYKYPIAIEGFQSIEIVKGGVPIHAGLDPNGVPCIWCEVEAGRVRQEPLHVFVVGTGGPMADRSTQHIGSFVQDSFVWHIYTP